MIPESTEGSSCGNNSTQLQRPQQQQSIHGAAPAALDEGCSGEEFCASAPFLSPETETTPVSRTGTIFTSSKFERCLAAVLTRQTERLPNKRRAAIVGFAVALACLVGTTVGGKFVSCRNLRRYRSTSVSSECTSSGCIFGMGCPGPDLGSVSKVAAAIRECSRKMELPGAADVCEQGSGEQLEFPPGADGGAHVQVQENSYAVPFMTAPDSLGCGFERLVLTEAIEEMASKYVFRFVGDSTTRRLAESFASIYSGEASPHQVVHRRQDYSVGNAKIIFDWAPTCSGPQGIGAVVAGVMRQEEKLQKRNGVSKRVVIITGYGVHDSTNVQEYQGLDLAQIAPEGEGSAQYELYAGARAEGILAQDSFSQSSMASCKQVTTELTRVAAAGERPSVQPLWRNGRAARLIQREKDRLQKKGYPPQSLAASHISGRESCTHADVQWDQRAVRATETSSGANQGTGENTGKVESAEEAEAGRLRATGGGSGSDGAGRKDGDEIEDRRRRSRSLSAGKAQAKDAPPAGKLSCPPLVFLLQNNVFLESDPRSPWMAELHAMQVEEIDEAMAAAEAARGEGGRGGGGGGGGGVFLVDDHESLYRTMSCFRADPIHFLEPVKLTEGKMLWHLLALLG